MDSIAHPRTAQFPKIISASDLQGLLDHYSSIRVLSLDCFDTLLWRYTETPIDVFYELQQCPTFQSVGISALIRFRAESEARIMKKIQQGSSEVELQEIYRYFFPDLSDDIVKALEQEEIKTECELCYAFMPVVELIRQAHEKKIKIIIVSDTYLKEHQLRELLSSTLPPDIMPMISQIFCSNKFGQSKHQGLFKHVLKKIGISPQSVLHIGDHPVSDYAAGRAANMHAHQLKHHDEKLRSFSRMQTVAIALLDSNTRNTRALFTPFQGFFATKQISMEKAEQQLGYFTLGPIMYAFAEFITQEVDALKKEGKNVKVGFLMRDGYLPFLACETLKDEPFGKKLRISRFASYAASFVARSDVDRFLTNMLKTAALSKNRLSDICRQLLLPPEKSTSLIQHALAQKDPIEAFLQSIHEPRTLKLILENSSQYRKRLLRHIQNELELQQNDVLMLVDLGYSGTTEQLLAPILEKEFHVDVIGRYLIALTVPNWQSKRRGLLDPSCCDERSMMTLTAYIALLEQLSTCNESSVVNYDEAGFPLFAKTSIEQKQQDDLLLIQQICLRFVKDAKHYFQNNHLSLRFLRDATLAALGRLLFFPSMEELHFLKHFQFELNLGTKDTFQLLDPDKGLESLRKRGLFSLSMEKGSKSLRTNTPAELRYAGMELVLSLIAQHRFGLDLVVSDMSLQKETIPAIVVDGNGASQAVLEASPTYDGYFALTVPVGNGDLKVGILFGKRYRWVQLNSIEMIPLKNYLSSSESHYAKEAKESALFQEMIQRDGTLFECVSENGFMMLTPELSSEKFLYRIVFRPTVVRGV